MTDSFVSTILTTEISTVKDSLNGKNIKIVVHTTAGREVSVSQVNGSWFKTPSVSDGVLFLAQAENTTESTVVSSDSDSIVKAFPQKRYYINCAEIDSIIIDYDKLKTYNADGTTEA